MISLPAGCLTCLGRDYQYRPYSLRTIAVTGTRRLRWSLRRRLTGPESPPRRPLHHPPRRPLPRRPAENRVRDAHLLFGSHRGQRTRRRIHETRTPTSVVSPARDWRATFFPSLGSGLKKASSSISRLIAGSLLRSQPVDPRQEVWFIIGWRSAESPRSREPATSLRAQLPAPGLF
jgi:hypothetical protein